LHEENVLNIVLEIILSFVVLADLSYANAYILATLNLNFQMQTILKRKANILTVTVTV